MEPDEWISLLLIKKCYSVLFLLTSNFHITLSFLISEIKKVVRERCSSDLCALWVFSTLIWGQWEILERVPFFPPGYFIESQMYFPTKNRVIMWWTCEFNQNSACSGLYLKIWLQPALFIWKWKDWIPSVHYSRRMALTQSFRTNPEDIFSYCSGRRTLLDINKSFVCSSQVEEDKGVIYILVINLPTCLFAHFVLCTLNL